MEHRDAPPSGTENPRLPSARPREADRPALPAPGPARPGRRRFDCRRIARRSAIVLGVSLGSYLFYLSARAARSWLAAQPAYQVPFRAIELEPPPPPWYRGGASGF